MGGGPGAALGPPRPLQGPRTASFRFPEESVGVLLCYSIEKKGGYVVVPNLLSARDDPGASVVAIQRMDAGRATVLTSGPASAAPPGAPPAFPKRFEVRRDMSAITVWGDRRGLLKIGDTTYRGGYVGFLFSRPTDVRVEGVVDEKFHRQKLGEVEDARFRKWQAEAWRRDEVLPAWTRARPEAPPTPPPPALPDDRDERKLSPAEAAALVSRCLDGDAEAAARLLSAASAQPGTTRLYLSAVAILAAGRLKEAEAGLTAVVASAPAFAPARAIRGLVRLNLRRIEEARADLLEARRLAPGLETAHVGLLRLAILEGDLEAASRTLDEAEAAGAGGGRLGEFRGLVQRARRVRCGRSRTRRRRSTFS